MNAPRIILLARRDIQTRLDDLHRFLDLVPVEMAVAMSPEDAAEAQKITSAVAKFQHTTAIVFDAPSSLLVYDDGSIQPLEFVREEAPEAPLVTLVD